MQAVALLELPSIARSYLNWARTHTEVFVAARHPRFFGSSFYGWGKRPGIAPEPFTLGAEIKDEPRRIAPPGFRFQPMKAGLSSEGITSPYARARPGAAAPRCW